MRGWLALIGLALAMLAGAGAADARDPPPGASAWAETPHGAVRLIAAVDAVGDRDTVGLGVQFRMNPGWHIYWRSPGDAGYPPRIDWTGSRNLAGAALLWPAPHRFAVLDLQTVGYSDAVVLPVDARLERPGEPLFLQASVDYLTCADICVPYVAELSLRLEVGPADATPHAHEIARARSAVPGPGTEALRVERVDLVGSDAAPQVAVAVRASEPLEAPDMFVEGPSPLTFSAPRMVFDDGRRRAVLSVEVGNAAERPGGLAGTPLTVTVIDGGRAVEHRATLGAAIPQPGVDVAPPARAAVPLVAALALGLLGGLILNLMPCVLPVLSIKLLSVVGHGGGDRREVRFGFLAAAAGILFSFMLLAAALIAVQSAGAAIGWGVQFQQPWFLTLMVLVVTLFAGNLWGVFTVGTPRLVGMADARAARLRGLTGHFLTGALATLLATPCSAPFLGTAVGFALSRGPAEIVIVFAAVAAGLALPYLAVAAVPSLATRLPKPGGWMLTLRRALGAALAGTGLWLLSVLAQQIGAAGALAVGGFAAGTLAVLALRRRAPGTLRPIAAAAVVLLASTAFFVPAVVPEDARPAAAGRWQPFAPERIPALVAAGRVVFVNVTADWCLTCKLNERLVLAREPVASRLAAAPVVAMQADWTTPDASIGRYLASFGRYGIPFDAVYGPALPHGEALPELLTPDAVTAALDRAGRPTANR